MTPLNAMRNGHSTGNHKTLELLPFPHAEQNSYRRLSLNSAWTSRSGTGGHDCANTLFNDLVAEQQRRRPGETPDLDAVHAAAILPAVEQRLQGIPELMDISVDSLRARQLLLRDLSARKPAKMVRLAREIVSTAVESVVSPLRAALRTQLDDAPFTCLETIDGVQQALRDLSYPTPDLTPQKRLRDGARGLDILEGSKGLSPKLRELLVISLRKRCDGEFQTALDNIVSDYICEALRQSVLEVHPLIDELRNSQASYRRNIEAVQNDLDDQRVLVRQRTAHSRSSVLLELESPNRDQLLAGIRDRHHCEDRLALTRLFSDKLQFALNELARIRYPYVSPSSSLTTLFIQLPTREIAAVVMSVVEDLIGDIHTVYTAVRSFGVHRVARELYDRSDPLTHLSSRDHVELNVEPHRDLVVRLPQPRGADDALIAEELREAFREFQSTCQFVTEQVDNEITVVRTLVGYPIAIEALNGSLLCDYASAAAQGHRPHLFGLLEDSPDGKAIPQLLALAQHLAQR